MPQSSLTRLMLVVLTFGVGAATLQSQSELWLGVLMALIAALGLLSVGTLMRAGWRGHRTSCAASLLAASAWLVYGFGPWSDSSIRGQLPPDAKGWAAYKAEIQLPTVAFIRLSHYIRPCPRAVIRTFDNSNRPKAQIVLTGRRDDRGDLGQLLFEIERTVNPRVDAFTRKSAGPGYETVEESLAIYLDACYWLASVLVSGLFGSCVTLLNYPRSRAESRRIRVEMSGTSGV